MRLHVGTSGWQYASWRGRFYPKDLPQRDWLAYFAEGFGCVEVNNTFYNLPAEATFRTWRESTPADFEFVLKVSRYLTHVRRLREPEEPVRLFMERSRPLRRRMAGVLLQLPPRFPADVGRLRRTLRAFPRTLRVAVEFRDASWYSDSVREVLAGAGAALVRADRRGESADPDWHDSGWTYMRLHEGKGTPCPCYGDRALDQRAGGLARAPSAIGDAFVFFNNDERACAVRDASLLAAACARRGLEVTRTPDSAAVQPG